jgi:ABC-type hemin transport system ATPase subunit
MTYTEEQRAIIARMGDITARIDAVEREHRATHTRTAHDLGSIGANLIAVMNDLNAAIEHSNRMGVLFRQHGDAFREFLDTL